MESCLIFVIVGLLGYSVADDSTGMTKEGASVYCGRRLANALAIICSNNFNMIKRDPEWSDENMIKHDAAWGDAITIQPEVSWNDAEMNKPEAAWGDDYMVKPHAVWSNANRNKRHARWSDDDKVNRDGNSWSSNRMHLKALAGFRGKRGPVDECCYQACTVDVLLSYC